MGRMGFTVIKYFSLDLLQLVLHDLYFFFDAAASV